MKDNGAMTRDTVKDSKNSAMETFSLVIFTKEESKVKAKESGNKPEKSTKENGFKA